MHRRPANDNVRDERLGAVSLWRDPGSWFAGTMIGMQVLAALWVKGVFG
jgi:hypothetical protein